ATTAQRLGAERVTIVYRRSEREMTAYPFEYTFAKSEGVQFRWWLTPVRFLGDGQVCEVELKYTSVDGSGTLRVTDEGECLRADQVIVAVGQMRHIGLLDEAGQPGPTYAAVRAFALRRWPWE
ncbi:MAG: hypothetical protein K6T70_09920, partial [Meiothermus ruber]|nr:hypothetical protein [Meiothermus ruber]